MNLVWNILTTLGARITIVALSLISSIVLARALGPDGLGLFALVLLLPELARVFGLLGIEQANAVYAGLQPNKRRTLVWHSVFIAAAVGGVVAIAGIPRLEPAQVKILREYVQQGGQLLIGAGADLTDLTRWVEVGQRRATGFR